MFFILAKTRVPFSSEIIVAAVCTTIAKLKEAAESAAVAFPDHDIVVTEQLFEAAELASAVPPELARAAAAWNELAGRTTPRLPTVRSGLHNYVSPYRRWKKRNVSRSYLLEELIARIERESWTWPWIQFGWLFGSKDGTLNSEKLMSGNNGLAKSKQHTPAPNEPWEVTER
jgi:hypothetical protein